MAEEDVNVEAHDVELVLHLVGSHHGCARPLLPVPDGPSEADPVVCLGAGVAERFWGLQRQHGWWGLAYMEALMRLADHRWSELEAEW
jgi:CRISPR-associated endonuclease/helicase Cas3